MSEIKIKRNEPFTMVPNHLVNNENISCEALAVIVYLAGKPDGWITRTYDIRKRFKWGDHTWRKVSKELRELKLLKDEKHQSTTDLIFELSWNDSFVDKSSFTPVENPQVSNFTPCENQRVYKERISTNKDLYINNKQIARLKNKKIENNVSLEFFEKVWEVYPLKKGKQKALEALAKKINPLAQVDAFELLQAIWCGLNACVIEHAAKQQLQNQGADIWVPNLPYLATWLNQGRWHDTYQQPNEILSSVKPKGGILNTSMIFN